MSQDVFDIMRTMRPMRRLKSDPVPQALVEEILDAGTWAPNSLNIQPYRFVVVRDPKAKAFFGERYDAAMSKGFERMVPAATDDSPRARNVRRALAFAKEVKDVPLLIVVCGLRDWPFAVPESERHGVAPPSYGSVYPCIQNILLACRAKGLGASLTTMHQVFESELCRELEIPDEFGPVGRRPSREFTYLDRWVREPYA